MKTKIHFTLLIFLSLFYFSVKAQTNTFPSTGAAGIGTTTPNASALLEIKSTTRGILIPQMTQAQRNAIAAPKEGLLIYQTNQTAGFYYYTGTLWKLLSVVNKYLSNLSAPTAVNVDMLPDSDNVRNVGAAKNEWRNLYLGGAVYLGGKKFLAYKAGSGSENTAVGSAVLNANTRGASNTGVGFKALNANTDGADNTATGASSLYLNTTGYYNTADGFDALYHNTTGVFNTGIGAYTLSLNTTGSYNTANGENSLYSNTNGANNTTNGFSALYSNTTGNNNVAIGFNALYSNTTGHNLVAVGDYALYNQQVNSLGFYYNTAVGSSALYSNTTGNNNTANGSLALYFNTTGEYNTANGSHALYSNTTGYQNIAIGAYSLYANTQGIWNTSVGNAALDSNTTGDFNTAIGHGALFSSTIGNDNTAAGVQALSENTTGSYNTATGEEALGFNTTGSYNTGNGYSALELNTTGSYNTADGKEAGDNVTDGSNNTFLGYSANCGSGGHLINGMALGNGATVTADNHVHIGNTSITSIGGQVSWTSFSDERIKNNIRENVPGLQFINLLKPVTYHFDLKKQENISGRKDSSVYNSKYDIEKIQFTGFLAQDVEASAKKIGYDFSGVDAPKNDKDVYGLRYSDFVVPLVKAVQELSKQNDSLKNGYDAKFAAQQQEIDELKAIIISNQSSVNKQQSAVISSASLLQNIPNPFSNSTTINYSLPQTYSSARIIITDKNGNILKQINLSANIGSVNINAATLASGAYQYSLYVDGKLIDKKQMILAK